MVFLTNLLFALLAGWLAWYLAQRASLPAPLAILTAVVVGFIVYAANLAVKVL